MPKQNSLLSWATQYPPIISFIQNVLFELVKQLSEGESHRHWFQQQSFLLSLFPLQQQYSSFDSCIEPFVLEGHPFEGIVGIFKGSGEKTEPAKNLHCV